MTEASKRRPGWALRETALRISEDVGLAFVLKPAAVH